MNEVEKPIPDADKGFVCNADSLNTPAYYEELRGKLEPLIGTEVWIRRESGSWQKAIAAEITPHHKVIVKWDNPESPGHRLKKTVTGEDLLSWQERGGMAEPTPADSDILHL